MRSLGYTRGRPVALALTTSAAGRSLCLEAGLSSNVAQNYPYATETEAQRAAAVAKAIEQFEGLGEKITAETTPLPELGPDEPGRPHRWWVFVCPKPPFDGRLHVVGYGLERHALYTVCDTCGATYLR